MAKTGFVWHESYAWHDTGTAAGFIPAGGYVQPDRHAESPDTKRRLAELVAVSGLGPQLTRIAPTAASEDDLLQCHEAAYVARIRELSAGAGGDAGELTPFGRGGWEIALLSAGGVIDLAKAVWRGEVANGYALNRPPGHHAEPALGRGFCIFGNGPVAIRHLQRHCGLGRVATVDWDVHHGNGTQAMFYRDPDVLTISLHQDNYYPPQSGSLEENGEGPGAGACLNLPLPPGTGHGAYLSAVERVVLPALERFAPEMIFVMSGFDANAMDPLGRMMLHSESYRQMTRMLMGAAQRLCGGKLVCCHEGGYAPAYVPFCGLAVLEELSGIRTAVEDPFLDFFARMSGQELQPHQAAVIGRAAALVEKIPRRS